ncbi:MAG: hypothetical protein K8L99_00230 [Anaerolineae bacterium]|nr:hypothetical protein [Anaerolineae bacterium]
MNVIDVVYIEDDDTEALIMQVNLRRSGINVLHIPSITEDQVSQLLAPPYQKAVALLFDEMLGGDSGLKMAYALRKLGDERPIFLLTAGDNPDPGQMDSKRILFRRKPVDTNELAQTIQKLQGS